MQKYIGFVLKRQKWAVGNHIFAYKLGYWLSALFRKINGKVRVTSRNQSVSSVRRGWQWIPAQHQTQREQVRHHERNRSVSFSGNNKLYLWYCHFAILPFAPSKAVWKDTGYCNGRTNLRNEKRANQKGREMCREDRQHIYTWHGDWNPWLTWPLNPIIPGIPDLWGSVNSSYTKNRWL